MDEPNPVFCQPWNFGVARKLTTTPHSQPMTDSIVTIAGGRTITARFTDGTTAEVFLRQVPIRLLPKYLAALDDEPALLELVADKPAGWADNLTVESHVELVAASEALNSDTFFAWLTRRVKRQESLAPGSSGELGKALLSGSKIG